MHIGFKNRDDEAAFELPGMENVISGQGNITFMYPGEINMLVDRLAGKNIIDLTIEEPSLEEIFMHYYH